MTDDEREIRRKLRVLQRAEEVGSASKAYRYFGIPKSTYFRWRQAYLRYGEQGLINKKPYLSLTPIKLPMKWWKKFST